MVNDTAPVHLQFKEKIKNTRRKSREGCKMTKTIDTVEILKGRGCVGRRVTFDPKKFVMIMVRRFIS